MLMRPERIIIVDIKWYIESSPLWRRLTNSKVAFFQLPLPYVCKHNLCRSSSSKHYFLLDFRHNSCEECNSLLIESFTFWDEDDYKYEIFSILSIEHMRTNIILVGKCDSHRHSTMGFSKNVVVAGTSYQVLSFWERDRASPSLTKITVLKLFWWIKSTMKLSGKSIFWEYDCEKTLSQISYS